MAAALDHLVVTAPTLEAGAAWVRAALGVDCQPGGRHERMGTHNLLLRLGPAIYLEVIAIDPIAAPPGRPRWFGLDSLRPDAVPRLAAWVARTTNLDAVIAGCPEPFGSVEPMSRGDLRWRLTIRTDGSLPFGGARPLLIEWEVGPHPAERLPDDGCEFIQLAIEHPEPDRIRRLLTAIDFHCPIHLGPGESIALAAEVRTPSGRRWLRDSSEPPTERSKPL
jgi:Glyoxalase-like domain